MGESELNEQNKDNVIVDFHVNGMPLRFFRKFKQYAEDYRGNYSITIQVLMEKAEILNYIMGGALEYNYVDDEEESKEEEKKEDEEVPTLG